jgi:hypothetical protein
MAAKADGAFGFPDALSLFAGISTTLSHFSQPILQSLHHLVWPGRKGGILGCLEELQNNRFF